MPNNFVAHRVRNRIVLTNNKFGYITHSYVQGTTMTYEKLSKYDDNSQVPTTACYNNKREIKTYTKHVEVVPP